MMEKSEQADVAPLPVDTREVKSNSPIPAYLKSAYWWAYLHPKSVQIFERQWLINLILWGNFDGLRDAALDELGTSIKGRILQVACVYGNFTEKLAARLDSDARLDVVDIAQIQLRNTRSKIGKSENVYLNRQDSAHLSFPDHTFDSTVLFFLLHEQPEAVRRATIRQAIRVTRKGGRLVFVDYHYPGRLNPTAYFMSGVFKLLEPFAQNFWSREILDWAPSEFKPRKVIKQIYFGGLYQKTVFEL